LGTISFKRLFEITRKDIHGHPFSFCCAAPGGRPVWWYRS
jgi:hypothetical protein